VGGHSADDLERYGTSPEPTPLLPDEELALEEQLARVREEKRLALLDPGPSWSQWFCFGAAKWYVVLGYLILLTWEIGYLLAPTNAPVDEVLPVVAVTLYGEFLLYRFLWYRPSSLAVSRSTRTGGFHRSWLRPVQYGRWTPEGVNARAGRPPIDPSQGPDPREFL
jgi:hypothetical protein